MTDLQAKFIGIAYGVVIHSILDVQLDSSFSLGTFSHLPQLLEDVVGKDTNECYKCYGDRGVPNCKLISSWEFDMVGGSC